MNAGDDRDRLQMADDDADDSQALTGGDITRYRALVARISYLSQDRPDLKFASMQVCCAMTNHQCGTSSAGSVAAERRAGCVLGR